MSSGQFVVRLPPALHRALTERARDQGVSLNQLVVALLAGGIGFTMEGAP
jgi:antitoxin HicB